MLVELQCVLHNECMRATLVAHILVTVERAEFLRPSARAKVWLVCLRRIHFVEDETQCSCRIFACFQLVQVVQLPALSLRPHMLIHQSSQLAHPAYVLVLRCLDSLLHQSGARRTLVEGILARHFRQDLQIDGFVVARNVVLLQLLRVASDGQLSSACFSNGGMFEQTHERSATYCCDTIAARVQGLHWDLACWQI